MNAFWLKHPWLRKGAWGVLVFFVVLISGLLAIAYVYMPLKITPRRRRT